MISLSPLASEEARQAYDFVHIHGLVAHCPVLVLPIRAKLDYAARYLCHTTEEGREG
jgi:hypothetical protein